MAGSGRIRHRLTTGRRCGIAHPSGRAAVPIAIFLLWAFTVGQLLVVLHSYTHPPTQMNTACSICLLGNPVAQVPDAPSEPVGPHTLCVPLAIPTCAPSVRPVQRTPSSRAPPLLPSTSAAA